MTPEFLLKIKLRLKSLGPNIIYEVMTGPGE